ncbi:MAG: M48 family metalloprotease [Thermodesulfovibrionia bacterium]|nr:M48 family metalloprotease [Thermodesulfovibrionia bacterium]
MKRVKKLLLCIIFLLVSSCAVNPVTGKNELMLVSESQEIQIGKETAPSMRWGFGGEYRDTELEAYLGGIAAELWKNSERPNLPMKFYIQNTSIPNAFALPGYVAITRGLLSDMDNEAQFAAVIGHEIGHVMARHTAQRLSRMSLQQIGLSIGAAALEGKTGSDALLSVGAIGSSLLLLKYDREQEIQADRLGVRYMSWLGYNPHEAMSAHEALERSVNGYMQRAGVNEKESSPLADMLSTHPRKEVRLVEIQDMINALPPYTIKGDGEFSKRFLDATKRMREINRIYFIYDDAERLYKKEDFSGAEAKIKEAIKKNDSQAPFHNLLGLIMIRQKSYWKAENSFRQALALNPDYQPSVFGLGLINYYQENYSAAIDKFNTSMKLYPGHLPTHFGLGKSYYQLKQYSSAIPHLGEFANAVPKDPEVHGMLGISYESTGQIDLAIREYGFQIQAAPDTQLGYHAKKRLSVLRKK